MTLTPPPYLSPSSIETFQKCPLQYKLSRIDKLDEEPGEAALIGNFVHDVLEELLKLPETERTLHSARVLLRSLYDERWAEQLAKVAESDEHLKKMRWKAMWCVEGYFEIEDPTTVVYGGLETPLQKDPEDDQSLAKVAGVPIKGFIDRWDITKTGVRIVDYKTGKTPRKREWQDGKFQQLAIYADAISHIVGEPAEKMTLLFVKDGVKLERKVTASVLDEVRVTVRSTYDEILERCETGEFEPRVNSLCSFCSFKPICPAWKS